MAASALHRLQSSLTLRRTARTFQSTLTSHRTHTRRIRVRPLSDTPKLIRRSPLHHVERLNPRLPCMGGAVCITLGTGAVGACAAIKLVARVGACAAVKLVAGVLRMTGGALNPCIRNSFYWLQREHDAVQLADDGAMSEYRRQVEGEGRKHHNASKKA